jgi:hypothetical protein
VVADSSGVHTQSVTSLTGHVHPFEIGAVEHAVGSSVELLVPGTKTSVPLGGNVEAFVIVAGGEEAEVVVKTCLFGKLPSPAAGL